MLSPTGFPLKVAELPDTLSDPGVYQARTRVCDLGLLRTSYRGADGRLGYRGSSEPVHLYVRKGGDARDTVGRRCLCRSLLANVGLGQIPAGAGVEPALVILGAELAGARRLASRYPDGWSAADVIGDLLDGAETRTSAHEDGKESRVA